MATYRVEAGNTVMGTYTAESEQEARDLCARDAGYESESDMEIQLGAPSELVAEEKKEVDDEWAAQEIVDIEYQTWIDRDEDVEWEPALDEAMEALYYYCEFNKDAAMVLAQKLFDEQFPTWRDDETE